MHLCKSVLAKTSPSNKREIINTLSLHLYKHELMLFYDFTREKQKQEQVSMCQQGEMCSTYYKVEQKNIRAILCMNSFCLEINLCAFHLMPGNNLGV